MAQNDMKRFQKLRDRIQDERIPLDQRVEEGMQGLSEMFKTHPERASMALMKTLLKRQTRAFIKGMLVGMAIIGLLVLIF